MSDLNLNNLNPNQPYPGTGRPGSRKAAKVGAIVTAGVLVLGTVMFFLFLKEIKAGYAGVIYNTNGGIEKETLHQGWHMVAPWKKVTEYPVSTETVYLTKSQHEGSKNDDSFNVSTKEGKPVNVDVMYTYHIDINRLPDVFTKFKGAPIGTIEDGYIKSLLKATVQEITSEYGVLDVYGEKRGEITQKISDSLNAKLEKDGIALETFSFGEIRPDESSMKAIQAKVDAQQNLEKAKIELEQQKVLAEKQRVEAQGNADKARIEAEGQAKANELLRQSLTNELVQYEWVKKWDGKMPTTAVGSGTGILLNVPDAQGQGAAAPSAGDAKK